ncbi:MAG TPA: copper chaperone PCu(A)C [Thermodesulfobacteriota bacterium]|nr:copper chaperone PCu(A)C [Thermodesulfobacteriota bacterium]
MKRYLLSIVVLFVLTGLSHAQVKVVVEDAWVGEVPPSSPVAAAYMTVKNEGSSDDKLLSVTANIAGHTMIHETVTDANGVTKMEMVDAIVIPAGKSVTLKPGGTHVMLMDLKEPVTGKEKIELDLKFEKAGDIKIEAPVKKLGD